MFTRMLRRPRHHHGHERVSLQETNDENDSDSNNEIHEANREESGDDNDTSHGGQLNPESPNETEQNPPQPDVSSESTTVTVHPHPTTHPFLTSQISVEREIRHRRQSTCTLLILFLLFRLWVEAIMQRDVGLIFLSIMGTTWTYRYWCSRREEEEYDRQIEENQRSAAVNAENTNADAASTFDPDLGLMSFQAQLTLAILESQRQMFENGGYGGNDSQHDGPGVSDEAKGKWKRYEWGGEGCHELKKLASNTSLDSVNYGSVDKDEECKLEVSSSKLEEGLVLSVNEEEPSCSICLCEYENGESVMGLPCNHIYHESCLDKWVANHSRCPLCNYDLMEGFEAPPGPTRPQQQNNNQELFRRMIGMRRASARSARRQLATMIAAMEDSVV